MVEDNSTPLPEEASSDVECTALQIHHCLNPQLVDGSLENCPLEPVDPFTQDARKGMSAHLVAPPSCSPVVEEQEEHVQSASSHSQSTNDSDTCTAVSSMGTDPYMSSVNEALQGNSFYSVLNSWLLSEVEPLPLDVLSPLQIEGVLPISREVDYRQDIGGDGFFRSQDSEHQNAGSTFSPLPAQLQIEASLLVTEDALEGGGDGAVCSKGVGDGGQVNSLTGLFASYGGDHNPISAQCQKCAL